jgi:hypothetical protein
MTAPEDFIRTATTLTAPALIPDISLYLATEITPIWQATEAYLTESGIAPLTGRSPGRARSPSPGTCSIIPIWSGANA